MSKKLALLIVFSIILLFPLISSVQAYAVNCWSYDGTDRETCEAAGTGNDCSWDVWGKYCMEKGCWDYRDQETCNIANLTGCFWQTDTNMGWETGWCEQKTDCWNYWENSTCLNVSGCLWKSSSCQGPPGCDQITTQSNCDASFLGCWWDYGQYCYKPGCWDYKTTDECSVGSCSWRSNSFCTESGGNCWNYNNRTNCLASECGWDNYGDGETEGWCYKKGCSDYDDNSSCLNVTSGRCAWNNESSYCYEKNCWSYWNNQTCTENLENVQGGCQWTQSGSCTYPNCNSISNETTCNSSVGCFWSNDQCSWEGCWNYQNTTECNAITGCYWKNSTCSGDAECSNYSTYNDCTNSNYSCWWDHGDFCEEMNCWSSQFSVNQTTCESDTDAYGLDCVWDSYWENCNEKWCGEYSDSTSCNNSASGKCFWNNEWCQEESCWGYNGESECVNAGCGWDNDYGFCEQTSSTNCYSFNESQCIISPYNQTCRWDSPMSQCVEKGCWDYQDNQTCSNSNLSVSCEWTQEEGGWCEDSGTKCWDYYIDSDCTSNGCVWDTQWNTCNEKGCWSYMDNATCIVDSNCKWSTNSGGGWGWCEKRACWNYDNTNQTSCENNTYGLTCSWSDAGVGEGACFGPWDLNCWQYEIWNNASSGQSECTGAGCTWEVKTGWCYEPMKTFSDFNTEGDCLTSGWGKWDGSACTATDKIMENPGCWIFDGRANECNAVIGCSYTSVTGTCDGSENVYCENITSYIVNNQTNQTLCEALPMLSTCCKWQGSNCITTYDSTCWDQLAEAPEGAMHCMDYNAIDSPTLCNQITGSPWYMPCKWNNVTGQCGFKDDMVTDVQDVTTKKNCEFLGGIWKSETVCGSDGFPETKSWCEMSTGSSLYGCDMACWSCNSSTACRASKKGYCQWVKDENLPSGGFCDVSNTVGIYGDCDKNCGSCEFYTGGDYTPSTACKGSKAKCKWDNATENCIDKKIQGCSDDCFYCFDKEECGLKGGGTQGTCKWDDSVGICKPTSFDKEICFDAEDNDNNGLIDCSDPTCMFDSFCGGGEMGTCWLYHDNSSCVDNGCSWFQDPWTSNYKCGMKGESCWIYETNETGCNNDNNCQWFSETHCEINHTKADSCFSKTTQTGCDVNTYCKWQSDPHSPKGGRCDFAVFECDWNQTLRSSKTSCESNSLCKWDIDPWSNEGWCKPKCFAMDSSGNNIYDTEESCNNAVTGGLCSWSSGWCEPNTTTVGTISERDCGLYNSNRTTCEVQPGCSWFDDFKGGMPGGSGGGLGPSCDIRHDVNCHEYNNQSSCDGALRTGGFNSSGNGDACRWVQEGTWSWCESLGMHCGPQYAPFNMTTGRPQINQTGCSHDSDCMILNDTFMDMLVCVPSCHNQTFNETTCGLVQTDLGNPMCVWLGSSSEGDGGEIQMGGWCDSKKNKEVFGNMEGGAPFMLAKDECGEGSNDENLNGWVDACGMGIKEMDNDYGIGIMLKSMTYAASCNGETLWDGSTGSGRKTTKGYLYLDTDGTNTGSCNSGDGAYSGFEFKLIGKWEWSNDGLKQTLSAKRCLSGNWTFSKLRLETHVKKMCQDLQGMLITINKADLSSFPELFDPSQPLRIYGLTAGENNTENTPSDTVGPGFYKVGSVDFKIEDCRAIGNIDMDGDGFYAYEDPDCKFIYLDENKGFKNIEDCFTPQDDDMNGLINCDDSACKDELICGGTIAFDFSDVVAPEIKGSKEYAHQYSADIEYTTDERSNGTVFFYGNDSTCSNINTTIRDRGSRDPNNSNYEKYTFDHSAEIDGLNHTDSLGYSLSKNTTYYYKIKVCDISSKCSVTGCLNFTTRSKVDIKTMKFTDPDNNENWLMNKGTGFESQGQNCSLRSNSSLGEVVDPENIPSIDIKQEHVASSGNITLSINGIDTAASKAIENLDMDVGSADISGGESSKDYVWMNESGWAGNDGLHTMGAPDNVTITMPGSDEHLYDCKNMVDGELVNCSEITGYATRYYNSTNDETTWTIPNPTADLWSYIVPQTPAAVDSGSAIVLGGGGGGGGGSSGVVVIRAAANVNISISSIEAGDMKTISIRKTEDVAFRNINISSINEVEMIKLYYNKIDQVPSNIEDLKGIYHYIKIDTKNITDSDINKAEIEFAVEKEWIGKNNIDESTITLRRWSGGKWVSLSTSKTDEDDEEILYRSLSPGLSYFAIVGYTSREEMPTGAAISICKEAWTCSSWSFCRDNIQTRECTDNSGCGTIDYRPEIVRECSTEKPVEPLSAVNIIVIVIVAAIISGVLMWKLKK